MEGKEKPTATNDASIDTDEAADRTSFGDDTDSITDVPDRNVDRRGYLKLGAAAATVGAVGLTGVGAADDNYDVVEVPANTNRHFDVTNGNDLTDTIIDVTAHGACFTMNINNADVRRVGIRGQPDSETINRGFIIVNGSNDVTIEDFYFADGMQRDYGPFGIFVHGRFDGHATFRRVHMAGFGDNALYCSGTHANNNHYPGDGSVEFIDCLSYNSTVSNFRFSRGRMENCVSYVDGRTPQYRNPGGARTSRGVWVWWEEAGDAEIVDCDIDTGGSVGVLASHGANLTIRDTEISGSPRMNTGSGAQIQTDNVGNNPNIEPPTGVPMSAEEAASGSGYGDDGSGGSEAPEPELENLLVIEGEDDEEAEYLFAVDGSVEPTEDDDATIDDDTAVEEEDDLVVVRGAVTSDSDAFRFDGEIVDFDLDGPATVHLDGETVCLASLERLGDELDEDERSHMTLHNVGDESYEYEFTVTGDAVQSTDFDSPVDLTDCVDRDGDVTVVSGDVGAGSKKTFYFTGTVDAFSHTADEGARMWVDSERVDESSIVGTGTPLDEDESEDGDESSDNDDDESDDDGGDGSSDDGGHELDESERSHMTLHNVGDESYEYEFTVTGDAVQSADFDSPVDSTDPVDRGGDVTVVSGEVEGDSKRTFYFTGTVDAFSHTADEGARLWVDGERVDESSIVGTGTPIDEDDDESSDGGDDGSGDSSDDDGEQLDNTLVIEGVDGGSSHYEFRVSGTVEPDEERGTVNEEDSIDDDTVEGVVEDDDADAYRFSGELVAFRLQGRATVRLNE